MMWRWRFCLSFFIWLWGLISTIFFLSEASKVPNSMYSLHCLPIIVFLAPVNFSHKLIEIVCWNLTQRYCSLLLSSGTPLNTLVKKVWFPPWKVLFVPKVQLKPIVEKSILLHQILQILWVMNCGRGNLPWPTIITNFTKFIVGCKTLLSRLGFRVLLSGARCLPSLSQ
jgi:hypothetical protein